MYAMVDREDDLKIGIKSTAILFGNKDKFIVALLQITTLALLLIAGVYLGLNSLYYIALLAGAGLFCYQQYLIKDRDRQLCFKAFLNNNWFGAVIFFGLFLHYLNP